MHNAQVNKAREFRAQPLYSTALQSEDYKNLSQHASSLSVVALAGAATRPGTGLFHSLLDGHPEILQIPHFRSETWNYARLSDEEEIAHAFVQDHLAYFDSRLMIHERWDELGDNRDTFVTVDEQLFQLHLAACLSVNEINERNVFLAVHIAYALATGVDPLRTKILFYHAHTPDAVESISRIQPLKQVIFMVRNPVNGLARMQEAIDPQEYYNLTKFSAAYSFVFRDFESLPVSAELVRVLSFEELHERPKDVMQRFCSFWNLEFDPSLLKSTYWGLRWWGDTGSVTRMSGFNPYPRMNVFRRTITDEEASIIESVLADRVSGYGIQRCNESGDLAHPSTTSRPLWLVGVLPMRHERRSILGSLRAGRWKACISGVKSYCRRASVLIAVSRTSRSPNGLRCGQRFMDP